MISSDRARVLRAMSGDLTVWEWGEVLACDPGDVADYCETHDLPVAGGLHGLDDLACAVHADLLRYGPSSVADLSEWLSEPERRVRRAVGLLHRGGRAVLRAAGGAVLVSGVQEAA